MPEFSDIKPSLDEEHIDSSRTETLGRTKRPKKTKVASAIEAAAIEKKQIESDRGLPDQYKGVYQSVDANGEPTEKIVIEIIDSQNNVSLHELDLTQLAQGHFGELTLFLVKTQQRDFQSPKAIRDASAIIMRAADKPIYLAKRDGYHCLSIGGAKYEFLVWRDKVYPLGTVSPIPIGVLYSGPPMPPASGTHEEWYQHIGRHVVANPYLLVVVCAAVASLLGRAFDIPRETLMAVGGSSTGKTTGQQVGQSLIVMANFIESFSGTEKGIRAYLEEHHDRPVFMEELRQAESLSGVINMIFDISNGASRKTASADQMVNKSQALSCGVIISNENSLAEMLAGTRVRLNEGIAARFFELVINRENGMFHKVPSGMTPKEFAEYLQLACTKYYGSFWDALVAGVSKHAVKTKIWIAENLPLLEAELCEGMDISDPVTRRMVRGMAGWACAGVLAVNLKLLKTDRRVIVGAVRLCLIEHLSRQKHGATAIGEQVISAVRDVIDRNASRFPAFGAFHATDQSGLYGYYKSNAGEPLYLFLPSVFDELIGSRFGTAMAARQLRNAGFLSTDSEGDQRQFRIAGGGSKSLRKRFYAIRGAIRFDAEIDEN
jgi:hypothetical protein